MELLHAAPYNTSSTLATTTRAQDLYKPDPVRLRRNLSAIINFAKYREEKLVPYTEMQGELETLLEERLELEAMRQQLVSAVQQHGLHLNWAMTAVAPGSVLCAGLGRWGQGTVAG